MQVLCMDPRWPSSILHPPAPLPQPWQRWPQAARVSRGEQVSLPSEALAKDGSIRLEAGRRTDKQACTIMVLHHNVSCQGVKG